MYNNLINCMTTRSSSYQSGVFTEHNDIDLQDRYKIIHQTKPWPLYSIIGLFTWLYILML